MLKLVIKSKFPPATFRICNAVGCNIISIKTPENDYNMSMKICPCKKAFYCSTECQMADRDVHKDICKGIIPYNPARSPSPEIVKKWKQLMEMRHFVRHCSNESCTVLITTRKDLEEKGLSATKHCGCGTVSYCSVKCQKEDWKAHKIVCNPLWENIPTITQLYFLAKDAISNQKSAIISIYRKKINMRVWPKGIYVLRNHMDGSIKSIRKQVEKDHLKFDNVRTSFVAHCDFEEGVLNTKSLIPFFATRGEMSFFMKMDTSRDVVVQLSMIMGKTFLDIEYL